MADTATATMGLLTVVTFPAEIDMATTGAIGGQLAAALAPGVPAVIADMTATTFCDSAGITILIRAKKQATAHGAELRLLLPCPNVVRVLQIQGVDAVLPIYHNLEEALAGPGVTGASDRPLSATRAGPGGSVRRGPRLKADQDRAIGIWTFCAPMSRPGPSG
jgi:anti-sigma B factor antagonist